MNNRINSHPHLYLSEHIEQIEMAFEGIKQWHSSQVWNRIAYLLPRIAKVHDLGKGSMAFQQYIMDPPRFQGNPGEKSHTPLSLLLLLILAQNNNWSPLDTLALAVVARGHHSELPTFPELKITAQNCPERDLDNFAGGEKARILKKQLEQINMALLEQETGLEFLNLVKGEDPGSWLRKMKRYITSGLLTEFHILNEEEGVTFRLKSQLLYSLLLEADKAFLAVPDPTRYLQKDNKNWEPVWIEQRIGIPSSSNVNTLRKQMRKEVLLQCDTVTSQRIFSLTAPTGCGKTLLAATWALTKRKQIQAETGLAPKIIVVLPFLSVIDQTVREYTKLLEIGKVVKDGSWLLTSHSLAERKYGPNLEGEEERFFLDTWRSEMIITTYDQFLLSLMEPKARYQMRFHNLCDALIIMDEVQSLPCKLWQPLDKVLNGLCRTGNSHVLLMSATLPTFVSGQQSLVPNYPTYFKAFSRYKLIRDQMRLIDPINIEEFCSYTRNQLYQWLDKGKRILITLNTRGSARKVRDGLEDEWPPDCSIPLFFISADVTPKDRMKIVDEIKKGEPCIVVSTQSIEAGVDIDMDEVFRDFGPLDSLIQVAGRCNREGKKVRCPVTIFDLVNENGNRYSEMIYDDVHLQVTREVLDKAIEVNEEEILAISQRYFEELSLRRNTGQIHLQKFVRWQEDVPVQELLRGKERLQYTFLVLEQDVKLKDDMDEANKKEDRWERREAWRKLSGRIAQISVHVYAKPGFHPHSIANPLSNDLWCLRPGYYSSKCGLKVEGETQIY